MIDPPPNLSPPMILAYSTTTASRKTNNDDNNETDDTNYDKVLTMDLISNSTNDNNHNHWISPDYCDDEFLLSALFPHHSLLVKHMQQYSSSIVFTTSHQYKCCFSVYTIFSWQKLQASDANIKTKPARRGSFYCSPKSHGHTNHVECCFKANYVWNLSKRCFLFSCTASNFIHNHPLSTQLTVADGRLVIYLENNWHLRNICPSRNNPFLASRFLRCVWTLRSYFLLEASHRPCFIKWDNNSLTAWVLWMVMTIHFKTSFVVLWFLAEYLSVHGVWYHVERAMTSACQLLLAIFMKLASSMT